MDSKRSILFWCVALWFALVQWAGAQSYDKNFVYVFEPQVPIVNENDLYHPYLDPNSCIRTIEYFDGFGYPIQQIKVGFTPSYENLIQPFFFDYYDRESTRCLPYPHGVASEVELVPFNPNDPKSFYSSNKSDPYCFSQPVYENSSLGRVLEESAPGRAWQLYDRTIENSGHTRKYEYWGNKANEVFCWYVEDGNLVPDGYYDPHQLEKKITKNEHWTTASGKVNTVEEFRNMHGQVVLVRQYLFAASQEIAVDTYFVYDHRGLLCFVIPPDVVAALGRGLEALKIDTKSGLEYLNKLGAESFASRIYANLYDSRHRLIESKQPDIAPVYYVYDRVDRLIAVQSGELRKINSWRFSKYDFRDRVVLTGIYVPGVPNCSRQIMQSAANQSQALHEEFTGDGVAMGYTCNAFPGVTPYQCFTAHYYDSYDWLPNAQGHYDSLKAQFNDPGFVATPPKVPDIIVNAKGYPTGTKIRAVDRQLWMNTCQFYDEDCREVLTEVENHMGGSDITLRKLSFTGRVESAWTCHRSNKTPNHVMRTNYEYDHMRRLRFVRRQMSGQRYMQLLAEYKYNMLGEMEYRILPNKRSDHYEYNIRGWLTHINNPEYPSSVPSFSERLYYDTYLIGQENSPQYNGNISTIDWIFQNVPQAITPSRQRLEYNYDSLDRLKRTTYRSGSRTKYYDETFENYDLVGNPRRITRKRDNTLVDDIHLSYEGNQIVKADERASKTAGFTKPNQLLAREYEYDDNGNLTVDRNKGISNIEYNFLNLPFKITGVNNEEIIYLYAADGRKMHKRYKDSSGNYFFTNYSAEYVYNDDQLDYATHPEGIFAFNGGTSGEYWWHLKDHLGNVRLTINAANQIFDCNEYYAFGGFMNDRVPSKNKLHYNSKELQSEAFRGYSLGWYDYGARSFNPDFGRFMSVDPLAHKYYSISPYVYCLNNPIKYVDPDGMKVVVVGTAEYRRKVVNDINQLRRDDKEINSMIVGLIESPNTHVIKMPIKKEGGGAGEDGFNSTGYNEKKADNGIPQGSRVSYDPDNRETNRKDNRTPKVGLTHELTHAKQADEGRLNDKSVTHTDPDKAVKILEVEAIRNENKIRKKTKDKKRTKYNGNEIHNDLLDD